MGHAIRLLAAGRRIDPIDGKSLDLMENCIRRLQIHGVVVFIGAG